MKFPWFPLLHTHTCYSLLDGVTSPKEWLHWCLENGVPAISFTDHGNAISFFDIIRFKDYIKDYNKKKGTDHDLNSVIGVPGVEFYVKMDELSDYHHHMCIWATSNEGYANLMKLASLAYDDIKTVWGNSKARITIGKILEYREGLAFGTGCIGSAFGDALNGGEFAKAEELFKSYVDWFGDDFYVEFHSNTLTHDWDKDKKCHVPFPPHPLDGSADYYKTYNNFLYSMVKKHGGKPIPVCDAHFIRPEDKIIQNCLLLNGSTVGWHYYNSVHQKTPNEMYDVLKGHLGDRLSPEEFLVWCGNATEISDKAKSIDIKFDYHLPHIDIPDHIKNQSTDYNEQTRIYMMERIQKHGRWVDDPLYIERFEKELDVIMKNESLNFIPYFLVLDDLCEFARSAGIMSGVGRGSAGASIISYYLKIIHIDPIKEDLPFERFLSHARIRGASYPDVDLDFQSREEIVKYLKDKYGLGFAQISTFTKIKTKNAIKDAMFAIHGRLRTDPEIDAICKTIEDSPQGVDEHGFLYGYTDDDDNYHEGEVERNLTLREFFLKYPEIEEMVKRLIGVVRGWSRNAAGFVISSLDLAKGRVPTMRMKDAASGTMVTVTQYNGKMVEQSRLVKADLLCINTLVSVSECIKLIKKRHGIDFMMEDSRGVAAVYRIPEEKDVYADFCLAKTDSSFQFNTNLIKKYLPDFIPTNRAEISNLTALCRPGALEAPIFDTTAARYYVEVRQKKRNVQYIHPDMKPIVSSTNSCFVFQESVMEFFVKIVGYSLEKADIVRSAIGKKNLDVIQSSFNDIRRECTKRGWTESQIETICQQIQAFARYSFNRCIDGNEFFYGRKGRKSPLSIKEMWLTKNNYSWAVKNNHFDLHKKYLRTGYGKAWSMCKDGKIRKNNIIDIRNEGVREVFLIETETGRTISATDNHKFPTPDGEKTLSELSINDSLYCNMGYVKQDHYYVFGGESNLPKPGQCGFQKKEYAPFKDFKEKSKKLREGSFCQSCGVDVSKKRKEVHHKDGNHGNQDDSNLMMVCSSCHKKLHYKMGRMKAGEKGLDCRLEKIKKIKYAGEKEVFDVEMEGPDHNFVVSSGIVTCNSHARAYAELGYITMYLKHYFPLEWWTSVLNAKLENDKEDDLRHFVSLLRDKVVSPTLAHPDSKFFIRGDNIVSPVGVIKGVGSVALDELCRKAPFTSIEDFVERIDHRAVNSGSFFCALMAGAADEFMDLTKPYATAKEELVNKYVNLRKKMKKNTEIRAGALESNSFNIFVLQKNHNMCFNRLLLADKDVQQEIKRMWPGLKLTGDERIPLVFQNVIVPDSTNTAKGLLTKKYESMIGMILLYDEGEVRRGVSKRSGRPWELLSIQANDGYESIEVAMWDRNKTPKWKPGHPFFVKGHLKEGYKTKVSIQAEEIYSLHDSANQI